MQDKKILIVGEVFVDSHMDILDNGRNLVRLGGIFHAIRVCSTLNINYAFAYYAPEYLIQDINEYAIKLNSLGAYKLGAIDMAPNIFLIEGSDESGKQKYENILGKQSRYQHKISIAEIIEKINPSDIIIFPGRYGTEKILDDLIMFEGKIHIDFNYDSESLLDNMKNKVATAILSTSSSTFSEFFKKQSYNELIGMFGKKKIDQLLIKENRGGSWLYDFNSSNFFEAPTYLETIMHSVGVGDVYDVAYISDKYSGDISKNMRFAAMTSVIYAKTMNFERFKKAIKILMENADEQIKLSGIRVPWNLRKKYNIYMAAPDFDYIDTTKLNELVDALYYHNFNPRLPIRENGQISKDMQQDKERKIYEKDLQLLEECQFMIATLLYNDQGTLLEIGIYHEKKKPIILYDPYNLLDNMFLKYSCDYYCRNKGEVVDAVFTVASRMVR